jgi:aldose 1-epimerase
MGTIRIADGPITMTIEPEIGAAVTSLVLETGAGPFNILRNTAQASRFTETSMYLMAPWTNRITGATFAFQGKTHKLRADWEDGSAIHGDVKTRPWRILDRTPLSARLACDSHAFKDSNWPWPYETQVRYEINDAAVICELGVRNLGDSPIPAGLGFHPFFSRGRVEDDVETTVPTTGRYPVKNMIPSGPAVADDASARLNRGGPLADLTLDDVFGGFGGKAEINWPTSRVQTTIECSKNFSHVVVFSPRAKLGMEPWFCIEPVTMVTDGFNLQSRGQLGTGVETVAPGSWLRATMIIRIQQRN